VQEPEESPEMNPVIGIDFGTTNSLCAWLDGDRPAIIPNARGARATPSVVAITARGDVIVGESAKNQAYINPENTVSGIKRLLGSEGLLSMGGRAWRPEEIVALVLGSLKRDAELHLSADVDRAVVTAPAHFSDRERRALAEAGRLAGLDIVRIVNEPTAAALARSWELSSREGTLEDSRGDGRKKSYDLVYDYGGGTFDVTVLERAGIDCRVLASRGDGRLGGADLDRELKRLAAEHFKAGGLDPDSDRFLAQQLAEAAERAKIELSERDTTAITLAFAVAEGKILHPAFELGRSDFEAIARPYVERSLDLVERALHDAGLEASRLDALVLSGGSSRIPLVRRMLKESLGLEPEGLVNPEEIVALGAAVCASLTSGSPEAADRIRVWDVVSRTYGVEVDGGLFVPLIRKNSPMPSTKSRLFTTVQDGQDSVEIHVLQGESRSTAENMSLGRFLLAGIHSAKAGEPRIRVDFAIDESDMLHVSAVDLESGAEQAISIADLGRGASDEPYEELAEKTKLLAARIEELREGLALERGLEAELDELGARAKKMLFSEHELGPNGGESGAGGREAVRKGDLRMLKAELEGIVGELLARRAEARSDARAEGRDRVKRSIAPGHGSGNSS
jgi:molecular chaperone DnaK